MSPNEQFSHYKILDRLGRGGMAMVYKAQDTRTHQIVALKVLHDHYSTHTEVIQRFNREADIFYRLKHPNIVPIIDHGVEDGTFYIAMAYIARGTLYEHFYSPREIDAEFTISILNQLASALDYAHKQGVIHRDLKLENILLDENDKPYLTDFGIAFLADATRLTDHQSALGTPMYMSPEQANGLDVTSRSDLYSLAVMAYLMTTGYHPFTGHDPYTVLYQHIKQPPPVPTIVNKDLPRAINAVLLRGLEKDPNKRFPNATKFVMAIEDAFGQDGFKTKTYIQLAVPNPQAIQVMDNYKDTVIGSVDPSIATSPPPSSSDIPSNNNRFVIFGGIVLVTGLIFGLLLALTTISNNQANALAIIQTQVQLDLGLELTATAQAVKDQLPTGTIRRPDGARLRSNPEPNAEDLGIIPFGERVTLIGRTGPGDFIELETNEGRTGFIKSDQVETTINLMTLPVTHKPESNNGQNESCDPDPFGYLLEDNVPILASPNRDAQILMTRPAQDRLKLIGRDADDEFYEIEVDDADRTRGFIFREQFIAYDDLTCLREIPKRDS